MLATAPGCPPGCPPCWEGVKSVECPGAESTKVGAFEQHFLPTTSEPGLSSVWRGFVGVEGWGPAGRPF